MKDIVAEIKSSVATPPELDELDAALKELGHGAHWLASALREIALEAQNLTQAPAAASERQQALADYATTVSSAADIQVSALDELRRGVEAWKA